MLEIQWGPLQEDSDAEVVPPDVWASAAPSRGPPVPPWQLVAAASSAPAPAITPNWSRWRHFSVHPVPQILWRPSVPSLSPKCLAPRRSDSFLLACQCHFLRAGNWYLPSEGTTSGLGFKRLPSLSLVGGKLT